MMDLIDRQKAIDTVQRYDFSYPAYMERFVSELTDAIKADLVDDLKALPSVQPSDSKIENAIRVLQSKYNKALSQDYICNPIAWALYQTWKEFDR